MHIHIDPLGGIAGDMFLAAVLDAWPEHLAGMIAAVRAADLPPAITLRLIPHADHSLTGSRFLVEVDGNTDARPTGPYREIIARLDAADLDPGVRDRTRAIFINSPSNPTGWTMSGEDQRTVLDWCRARGIWPTTPSARAAGRP